MLERIRVAEKDSALVASDPIQRADYWDSVATGSYIGAMKAVGVRELKNRLSEYLRLVRGGEEILVTDRGQVIAELGLPGRTPLTSYPVLNELARRGLVRLGAPNDPTLYPAQKRLLRGAEIKRLLDKERGEH
jgi:antitoxin (DNA-binding transcriptional repressor) of toxin-antitoxin stability system